MIDRSAIFSRHIPASLSSEIERILDGLARVEQAPVFLQRGLLIVLIKHGKYISLDFLIGPHGGPLLDMPSQEVVVSGGVVDVGGDATGGGPAGLGDDDVEVAAPGAAEGCEKGVVHGVEEVLVAAA